MFIRVHPMRPEWICRLQMLCSTWPHWHRVITTSAVHMEYGRQFWVSVLCLQNGPPCDGLTMTDFTDFTGSQLLHLHFAVVFFQEDLRLTLALATPSFCTSFNFIQLHSTSAHRLYQFHPISSNFTSPNES